MPDLTLGSTPPRLTVWLVDAAPFAGSVTADNPFPAAPELVFDAGTVWPATLDAESTTAAWLHPAAAVEALAVLGPRRVTLRDPASHHVWAHGTVYVARVVDNGVPSTVAPGGSITVDTLDGNVSITYSGGGGTGGGSDVLTVVDGEPVELDDDLPVGHLLGFRVLSSTVIGGRTFAPGDYIVSRTVTGWDFRLLASADTLEPDPVPDVEVTAGGPTWVDDEDNGGGTWTTPTEEGIDYSPASGAADPGEEVTVTATAQEGYDLVGTSSWSHTFPAAPAPPDTTAPTPGTLAVTGTGDAGTTRTLTVTGASDAGGLHAQPYRFSTNGGTTWSTYQTSNAFTTGALTAGTYQPRVMVRDAAGNTATASAADFTVAVPDATETFDRPDDTTLSSVPTTTGGLIWAADTTGSGAANITGTNLPQTGKTFGGKFATASSANRAAILQLGQSEAEISFDYDVSDNPSSRIRIGVAGAPGGGRITGFVHRTEGAKLYSWSGTSPTEVGTYAAAPTTGRLSLGYDGAAAYMKIDGATVISGAVSPTSGTYAGIGVDVGPSGTARPTADNMTVVYL